MQAANYRVILDACVLANFRVCDLFLRLAESPQLYLPLWSKDILEETRHVQQDFLKWPPALVASFRENVEAAFPEAMVVKYEQLIPAVTAEARDRHVLAAAIRGRATTIVTFNLKHFPAAALEPWDIEVRHPSDYLLTLYSIAPAVVVKKLGDIAAKKKTDLEDLLLNFGKICPGFASQLLSDLGLGAGNAG
jgi:hypothetical protein